MKRSPIVAVLAIGVAFEALTVLATQDRAVRAVSPWPDDPYNVFVSLAELTVPMLPAAIALRLPAWRAPGGPGRARQTARAGGALLGIAGLSMLAEWAAVAAGAHRDAWDGRTAGLLLATAFRDPLWTATTRRPVTSVPVLVAFTVGAGLTAAATAAARPRRSAR
jgi:hypothetical protein